MTDRIGLLLHPLNFAAVLTWLAVALEAHIIYASSERLLWIWALLATYLAAYFAHGQFPERYRLDPFLFVLKALCALTLCGLAVHAGVAPALLVILAAQIVMMSSSWTALVVIAAMNTALYSILRYAGHEAPLTYTLVFSGFQAFAALIGHYARSAERARDALMTVNANLLATRSLLADSARDSERLRVARELHDVAGHKLTALMLQLRAVLADPSFAGRTEPMVALQLSQDLLGDLRDVVRSLRDSDGLDLQTALQALAAPFLKPRLQLHMADDVHVSDATLAEVVLRIAQEALTNSARHAGAEVVTVSLAMRERYLEVTIEDNGHLRGPWREGNGLIGMRERIVELGGTLSLTTNSNGALRIYAVLPT